MELFDALTGQKTSLDLKELIFLKEETDDYILSIPHSGALFPVELVNKINIGRHLLVGTDLFTDQLFNTGKSITIISKINKYVVNVSRFKDGEKSQSLPKHLQRDPFHGVSPFGYDVYLKDYTPQETKKLLYMYNIYHDLLKKAVSEMKERKGFALMLDCHSMNSIGLYNTPDEGETRADFVIGTLDGSSAHPEIIAAFHNTLETEAEKFGLTVRRDYPYKGGFITINYGRPKENINVIQLEVRKSNYMNEGLYDNNELKINPHGLKMINSIISKSMEAASEEAADI